MKDEYERKLKLQESATLKFKTKYKELEKSSRDKDHIERKLQDSLQELEKLNLQQSIWKKKMKEGKLLFIYLY